MVEKAISSTLRSTDGVFSVPGKVFLLGEYAVLAGAPALIAAIPPRFSLSRASFPGSRESAFHPESPAGRSSLVRANAGGWHWLDPASGDGGFGASTAQFALAAAASGVFDPETLWREYRRVHGRAGVPPSGADLMAQVHGGVVEFRSDGASCSVRQHGASLTQVHLLVLQASHQEGRKTATHHHLSRVTPVVVEQICSVVQPILERALRAFAGADAHAFAACLEDYADGLSRFGLEVDAARADRGVLAQIPGVLGVKGAGALQSDALVLVIDPTVLDWAYFQQILQKRGLRLWCDRVKPEPGLEWHGGLRPSEVES